MKTMTIGKKLGWCFAASCVLSLALGVFTWVYVSKLKSEIETNMLLTAQRVDLVSDI